MTPVYRRVSRNWKGIYSIVMAKEGKGSLVGSNPVETPLEC